MEGWVITPDHASPIVLITHETCSYLVIRPQGFFPPLPRPLQEHLR
ncbi:MAG: hypothetical protein ACI83D_000695 [Planctomycetota bacterium]|jgi:hypothetical protein